MTKREATARFIYGSNEMNNRVEYDNEDIIIDENDTSAFCDGNCLSCEMVCPYKDY
jgi:hypothetical protein